MSSAHADVPRRGVPWWQVAVAAAALVVAAIAVWVTLEADFLAHPGWLAAQKADFILGPVFVGLYWLRQRPESRFGPLLLAFGVVGAVYILQSSSNPWSHSVGVLWEIMIYLGSMLVILTFPTGRLDGLTAKLIVLGACFAVALPWVVVVLMLPQLGPDGSISGCVALCPENALAVASTTHPLAVDLLRGIRVAVVAVGIATAGLLIWRMVTGTPPQRRALAIGTPIAMVFLLCQILYQTFNLMETGGAALGWIQWALAGARSLVWYGFLFALIAAQLFAGRTLHKLVRASLRRPSLGEIEAMLREPLGDPNLRLTYLDGKSETAADQPVEPGPGREVTIVERGDGSPGAAIDHDAQLADDPELLRAAGAVALLAADNVELDAAWNDALHELRQSRARILAAGDIERREIERNLHDGAQQRLVALRVRVQLIDELIDEDPGRRATLLRELGSEVDEALDEVRALARGVYPPLLTDAGIVRALRAIGRRHPVQTTIDADGVGRYPPELERAVYFCCLEALQNAAKHANSRNVSITLVDNGALHFAVRDDGIGFAAEAISEGQGLTNMRDRLAAVGGELVIESAPGEGTSVLGVIARP